MTVHIPNAELARLLPAASTRLLLLTDAPSDLEEVLSDLVYDVRTCALCQPGEFIQWPTSSRDGVCMTRVDLPEIDASSFDVAFVQGVSPRIHPLALFNQLGPWLTHDATLLITGEKDSPRMPHWLDYLIAIGARCGFVEQAFNPSEVGIGTDEFVRVLRRCGEPRWQLRHVSSQDFEGVATLFQEVFGHSLSRELWAWKYANGRGNSVVATRHGEVVAHYGGMYRDILLDGKPAWAFQACDVMVHPRERGVMTKQGPFLLTAATVAEIYAPLGLGFGFPNSRAMLVAEKMGLYSEVGHMVSVRWEPSDPGYRWRTRARALIRHDPADRERVQALWKAMAQDLDGSVVGVRDWDYLEYRYFNHPHNHYELMLVSARLTGAPVGVVVLRRLEDSCELLDVIAPLKNLSLLIDQACRVTGLWGLSHLYCWITKNQAQHFLLCSDGKEDSLNIRIPASCWTDESGVDVFKDRWWLMSGDTDFR